MKKIYIIDDEKDFQEMLQEIIEINFKGFLIEKFLSLDEALLQLDTANSRPAIILSDVFMSTGSGLRLKHELDKRKLDIPQIYISGYSDKIPEENITMLKKPLIVDDFIKEFRSKLNLE